MESFSIILFLFNISFFHLFDVFSKQDKTMTWGRTTHVVFTRFRCWWWNKSPSWQERKKMCAFKSRWFNHCHTWAPIYSIRWSWNTHCKLCVSICQLFTLFCSLICHCIIFFVLHFLSVHEWINVWISLSFFSIEWKNL